MPSCSAETRPGQSLTRLQGVGPALAAKLQQLGIRDIRDLLFHLPLRYEDRTRVRTIASLKLGDLALVEGEVLSSTIQFGRRRSLLCMLKDRSGLIGLRFFHFSAAQRKSLEDGKKLRCFGEIRRGRSGFEIYHPEYQQLAVDAPASEIDDSLTPIYPTTEGLQQIRLRKIIDQALALMDSEAGLPELLPAAMIERLGFPTLKEAIRLAHRPPSSLVTALSEARPGQQRLAFEELLAHRLGMRRLREQTQGRAAPELAVNNPLQGQLVASLGFELTAAQRRASDEIAADLANGQPMLRLLQGDVGSGKTVLAALAALQCIGQGYQVALMAPTEILAEQHLLNFLRWLQPLNIRTGWLSGKTRAADRKALLSALASGECQLLIGTHALFQESVQYRRLGLVIIDEQHRFGVHQRLALRDKADGIQPHQLVMTATPIPRTLAMTAYADLDTSVIDELPPGRQPVNTLLISAQRRDEVVDRIASACADGSQAYWVCTLIEESETLQAQAAEATASQLAEQLTGVSVGLLHGRMGQEEKTEIMARFKAGALQLLVATTVIEVGVDVANASLMVIENPERLGLAQLHQLRGRVGRGSLQSHCILLYQTPLSRLGKERLRVMRESNDGFYIAEKDLEFRGPGQVLGTQQTGLMTFKIADLARDGAMLDSVQRCADEILSEHPQAVEPLIKRWLGERIHYIQV